MLKMYAQALSEDPRKTAGIKPMTNDDRKVLAELPDPLRTLLDYLNGAVIRKSGTHICTAGEGVYNIRKINSNKFLLGASVPKEYIVFAVLSFGDLICINSAEPYDVIQWDIESNEEFLAWNDLEEWLKQDAEG